MCPLRISLQNLDSQTQALQNRSLTGGTYSGMTITHNNDLMSFSKFSHVPNHYTTGHNDSTMGGGRCLWSFSSMWLYLLCFIAGTVVCQITLHTLSFPLVGSESSFVRLSWFFGLVVASSISS
jgi:hypothetical protein